LHAAGQVHGVIPALQEGCGGPLGATADAAHGHDRLVFVQAVHAGGQGGEGNVHGVGRVPGAPFVGLPDVEEHGSLVYPSGRLLGTDGRNLRLALHTTKLYVRFAMSALEDLLVIQEHDSAADRLRHRLETLPEKTRLAEVDAQLVAIETSLTDVDGRRDEVLRRQQRHEDELASVEAKITEVDRRLYSGSVSAPRELQAMEADVTSLKRHRSDLEDRVLEAMQDREPLDAERATLGQRRDALAREGGELRDAIAAHSREVDVELATALEARRAAAAGLPDDLLSRYERLRATQGGVGAARLVNGRCSGCHLTLPATELDRIRHEDADALVLCDQCGRILVC